MDEVLIEEYVINSLKPDNHDLETLAVEAGPAVRSPQNLSPANPKSIEHQTETIDPQLQTSTERLVVNDDDGVHLIDVVSKKVLLPNVEDKRSISPLLPAIAGAGRGAPPNKLLSTDIISPGF